MEKKRYIKPHSVIIYDCGISLMEGSPWKANGTIVPTAVFNLGVAEDVEGVYNESDISSHNPNEAKMHDLWEEW